MKCGVCKTVEVEGGEPVCVKCQVAVLLAEQEDDRIRQMETNFYRRVQRHRSETEDVSPGWDDVVRAFDEDPVGIP